MKYIHVDDESGRIAVFHEPDLDWMGWIFEVPDDFVLTYTLADLHGADYLYVTLIDREVPQIKTNYQRRAEEARS